MPKWNFQEQRRNNQNRQEQNGKTKKVPLGHHLHLNQGSKVEVKPDL